MLLVKTYLDTSPIHGVGVFAGEFIPKGTLVWRFDPLIDIVLTAEQVAGMPEAAKEFTLSHAVPYPFGADNYCLTLDNAQYMNHSPEYNLQPDSEGDRALMDIPEGTELTVDYFLEDHRTDEGEIS
ncbi:MAG: SET domain-containing protein-lysine N-methyltransferase [Candidatus Electrothrix sp. AUS4]|nr:SET domain-containing protein-lysine N-methyltransferase [Candidatus Electrothrix sp. AUS4]